MAISRIGSAVGNGQTVTIPTHAAGDLIVIFAYRDGSNTRPGLASGYTAIIDGGGNTNSMRVGYVVATDSSTTSGTWTSATSVIAVVYRATGAIGVGVSAQTGAASTTVTYPALTGMGTDSWVVGFAGHRATNTTLETAPTGMTNFATDQDATDEVAAHDTNAVAASWSATAVSVGGTSSGWRSATVEITEIPPAGGSQPVSGTTGSPTITSGVTFNSETGSTYQWSGAGSITFSDAATVYYLIVAGGGGGGLGFYGGSGGGGAGGLLGGTTSSTFSATASTYTVTVGAGGAGAAGTAGAGANGGNSSISGTNAPATAIGGGGGANDTDGITGGSGGGGGFESANGGAATSGQGNAGGRGFADSGGGGGAGTAGGEGTGSAAGAGGNGLASSITGSSVTYAGGGGGGAALFVSGVGGAGGTGGGGAGGNGGVNSGVAGTDGLGGGGGGAGGDNPSNGQVGGDGGDGVVILFVPDAAGGGTDTLTADDLQSASEVSQPVIGQTHGLNAGDIQAQSSVTQPTMGQTHGLAADDLNSASSVSTPAVGQVHAFNATDVDAASEVTSPVIGQTHVITADDVQSAANVTQPNIGQVHGLAADDLQSAATVSTPTLAEVAPGQDALTADDLNAESEVTTPTIGQTHNLAADDVQAQSSVTQPTLTILPPDAVNLVADDLEAASTVSTPTLTVIGGRVSRGGIDLRHTGARERFWQAKATEWLDERLATIARAKGKPQRVRKRVADRAVDVPAYVLEVPELAPIASALDGLADRIAAPQPDYTELARQVAAYREAVAAWNTKQRRRRDAEALLLLAD